MGTLSVPTFPKGPERGGAVWIESKNTSSNLLSSNWWMGRRAGRPPLQREQYSSVRKTMGVTDGLPWPQFYYSRAKNVMFELLLPLKCNLSPTLSYMLLEAFIHFGDWRQNDSWNNESFFSCQLLQKSHDHFTVADNDLLKGGLSNTRDK